MADLRAIVDLLAADVVALEYLNQDLSDRLRITLEMLSESLDIANQAFAHIHKMKCAQP